MTAPTEHIRATLNELEALAGLYPAAPELDNSPLINRYIRDYIDPVEAGIQGAKGTDLETISLMVSTTDLGVRATAGLFFDAIYLTEGMIRTIYMGIQTGRNLLRRDKEERALYRNDIATMYRKGMEKVGEKLLTSTGLVVYGALRLVQGTWLELGSFGPLNLASMAVAGIGDMFTQQTETVHRTTKKDLHWFDIPWVLPCKFPVAASVAAIPNLLFMTEAAAGFPLTKSATHIAIAALGFAK